MKQLVSDSHLWRVKINVSGDVIAYGVTSLKYFTSWKDNTDVSGSLDVYESSSLKSVQKLTKALLYILH